MQYKLQDTSMQLAVVKGFRWNISAQVLQIK